jgi:hypothetical protein
MKKTILSLVLAAFTLPLIMSAREQPAQDQSQDQTRTQRKKKPKKPKKPKKGTTS